MVQTRSVTIDAGKVRQRNLSAVLELVHRASGLHVRALSSHQRGHNEDQLRALLEGATRQPLEHLQKQVDMSSFVASQTSSQPVCSQQQMMMVPVPQQTSTNVVLYPV